MATRGSTTPRALTAVSALVASAAIGGFASTASAHDLGARGGRGDRRLAVIDRALRPAPLRASDLMAQAPSQPPLYTIDIPGGPLRDVLALLSRASGVVMTLSSPSLGDIYSMGVRGTMTLPQALTAILDGTTLVFRSTSPGSFLVELPQFSDRVSVTGNVAAIASPKYQAPLRDIPQTIDVIPREAMDAQGVTTLSEALRNVPGITLQAGEGGGASNTAGDMFNMRGFNASNSLFVDNVRDDGLVSRDVFNLEQVEVFMGPTGSDVGRGTAAGYVNMQTKTPRLPAAASAALTIGSAAQRRATLDINQPLVQDGRDGWLAKSAVRLNVLWQDSGVPGRDEARNATRGVAPSIGLGLDTPTRLMASAQLLRQDNEPDYGIPGAAWHASTLAPTTKHTARPVDPRTYYGSPGYDYDRSEQNTVTARLEHDLNPAWTAANQTRYNRTHREAVISTIQNVAAYDPATDLVTIARQGNERENTILSNQTNVIGRFAAGGLRHSVNASLEVARETQFAPALTGAGSREPVDVYAPNPHDAIAGYAPARSGAFTRGETTTVALSAFDAVPLGSRLQINGGVRWEHYETAFRSVDAAGATAIDETGRDSVISGKVGVVAHVAPRGNVYASYGTSVTPPGGSNFSLSASPNNQNNPNVEPQLSSNLEAGTKWDVAGGRLSLTGAVFHTVNENVLFTVDAAAVPPVFNQDDKQRVNGVSVGAAGEVMPGWNVLANAGYLDTENLTQNEANAGKRLTLAPRYSGSVWSTYRLPRLPGTRGTLTIGGGVRAAGNVFINAANTIEAPGYHLVDALVEYAVNEHLTLRLNVYNVTNERYIRNVNNNGGRYNPGYPRTAQVTSVVKF